MKIYILIVFCLFFSSAIFADDRNVHIIKILNNQIQDRQFIEARTNFAKSIDNEAILIKKQLDLHSPVQYHLMRDSYFNKKDIESRLDTINISKNDIVIILYVGHGVRDETTSNYFPKLVLNNNELMDFVEVQERVALKNPSFILSFIIACNNKVNYEPKMKKPSSYEGDNTPSNDEVFTASTKIRQRSPTVYQKLFTQTENKIHCIDFVSSKEGTFTYIDRQGGFFFPQVIKVLNENFDNIYTTWEKITREVTENTLKASSEVQMPICKSYFKLPSVTIKKKEKQYLGKNL